MELSSLCPTVGRPGDMFPRMPVGNADAEAGDVGNGEVACLFKGLMLSEEVRLGKARCQDVIRLLLYGAEFLLFAGQSVVADISRRMLFTFMLPDLTESINDLDLQKERRTAMCFQMSLFGRCQGCLTLG